MSEFNLPERQPKLLPEFVERMEDQPEGSVALFDADGTLWRNDVADDFTKWMIDTEKIPCEPWEEYLSIYKRDHAAGCRFLLRLYKGLKLEHLHREIWSWWRNHAHRQWIPEALEALYFLADRGIDIWVVTGSPTDTMLPLKDFLPVSTIVGMDFAIDEDLVITGDYSGISCADEGKAEKVKTMVGDDRKIVFAAGNGSLDRAMMELATDLAWAVYPNAEFEATARARGWPILLRPDDFVEEAKLA